MKEVVLHVGMHKTGTTSIQATLLGHDDGRVRLADLGDQNHSIPITTIFSPNRHGYYIHTRVGRGPAEIDALAAELSARFESELARPVERLVVSGEDISLLEPDGVRALRDFLVARADRVRVLAYVRDPVGFASSAFQQYVSGGKRDVSYPAPEYRNRFAKFVEFFGADAVEFVKFDRDVLHGGSVVPDFCHRVGIRAKAVRERKTNESVPADVTRLVFAMNRFGLPTQGSAKMLWARNRFVWQLKQAFEGPSFKLPLGYVLDAMDREDVAWMEQASGLALMPEVDAETCDEAAVLRHLEAFGPDAVPTLRALLGEIDTPLTRATDPIALLNAFFLSLYFSPDNDGAASPRPRAATLESLLPAKRRAA